MAKRGLGACGNNWCRCSTGIHEGLTFGSGELDQYGFWEKPCRICAEQHDTEMAAGRRDELINEQVAHYRGLGHNAQEALQLVQRHHEWIYLLAWPYAQEVVEATRQSAP